MKPIVTFLAILGLNVSIASAAESLSTLLQRAIYAEETEGNLDSAIKLYEQIAAETAANRTLAAQAQYRLAVCYQKKGDKDQAVRLFGELVQSPIDPENARLAREALVKLGATTAESTSVRKLPLPAKSDWIIAVSPDGRFVAHEPIDSPDLAVSEWSTGKTWTAFKPAKGESLQGAWFSPDNKRVAYQPNSWTIVTANLDGSDKQTVFAGNATSEHCWLNEWPDLEHMVLWVWNPTESPATKPIYSFDLKTRTRSEIARTPSSSNSGWFLSPNRTYVVQEARNYPRRIVLRDLKTGNEETVINRDTGDFYGWSADGEKIIYSKRRGAGTEIFAHVVKDAKPIGESQHLWSIPEDAWVPAVRRGDDIHYYTRGDYLWRMDGFLDRKARTGISEIAPEELLFGPDGTVTDRIRGVSLTLPKDWNVVRAGRIGQDENFLGFTAPKDSGAWVQLYYRRNSDFVTEGDPRPVRENVQPKNAEEVGTWLRKIAQRRVELRLQNHYLNYRIRPESLIDLTIGGRPALSWVADYTRAEKAYAEYLVMIYSDKVLAQPFAQAPVEKIDEVRAAYDELIKSIRLP